MCNYEWLKGYLDGISKLNSIYGHDADYFYELRIIDRQDTPLETIICANKEWEGKFLSTFEYKIEKLHNGFKGLEEYINKWFLEHIRGVLISSGIDRPYDKETTVINSNKRKISNASDEFIIKLKEYLYEGADIYKFKLETYSKKPETPIDYSFEYFGDRILIYGATKSLILSLEATD